MQVFVRQALCHLWYEFSSRLVTLKVFVVLQIARAYLADIAIDVLAGLLSADAESVAQVPCGEAALPKGNGFDIAVAQQQVPTEGPFFRPGCAGARSWCVLLILAFSMLGQSRFYSHICINQLHVP